jgi:hypothetical protein
MANQTIVDLSDFHVCFVIDRDDPAAWPILSLVIRYLSDVLWQFVDG